MCSPLRVGISIVRWLVVLLFAVTVEAAAPTIAITGAAVEPNGAFIDIYMPFTVNTNGTFSFGYGSNNVPSTSTPYYKVVCPGYDDTAATNTISWSGFLTYPIRMAYPNATTNNIVVSGSSIIIPVAMSEFVYSNDVSGTLTFPVDGWYAQGGTNTAAGTVTITNNSTLAYPKVIANWSYPGTRQRIYGPTWTNRVVAFHQSGMNGRPVRVVKFFGKDSGGNVVSPVLVTTTSVDKSLGDASAIQEYIGILSTNGLANKVVVTNNFAAYPWRGDANSVLDTSDGTRTLDTSPLYSPQKWWSTLDAANSYGQLVCVVDSTNGVQHGGITNMPLFVAGTTALVPFDTLDHAFADLKASNNTYFSHNDCGGGTIYVTNCVAPWSGSSVAGYNTTPPTWVTITRYPGVPRSSCVIGNIVGTQSGSGTDHFYDLTWTLSAGVSTVTGETYLWLDNCTFNITGGTAPFYQNGIWYVTDCTLSSWGCSQGLSPYTTVNAPLSILRGSKVDPVNSGNMIMAFVNIGNTKTTKANGGQWQSYVAGQLWPNFDNIIIAFNKMYGMQYNSAPPFSFNSAATNSNIAIIQNVFEVCNMSANLGVSLWADGTGATATTDNVLEWYNTFLTRQNCYYNDTAAQNPNKTRISLRGNWFVALPIKSDIFVTQNSARTNNWTQYWGVGSYGNCNAGLTGFSGSNTQVHEWLGVNCFELRPASEQNTDLNGSTSTTNSFPFINPQYSDGVNNPGGNGDYNYKTTYFGMKVHTANTPNMQPWWGIALDANGEPRGGFDPMGSGAFVRGQPRRTAMMFAN